jgi:hypothetical protein
METGLIKSRDKSPDKPETECRGSLGVVRKPKADTYKRI